MKLAILGTRGIPAQYGGFETFAEEISIRLVEKGVHVTVYCDANNYTDNLQQYKGVQLVYVTSLKLWLLTTILFDLKCLWHARKQYDVVYMLGYGASLFAFIPRLWKKKVWINMDGLEWKRSKWSGLAKLWLKLMEKIAMRTPSRIIADAKGIEDDLRSRYSGIPPCSMIPYGAPLISGAELSLLAEFELGANQYYLLVCRLEPENYILEILRGYILSNSKLPLIIVGNHKSGTDYVNKLLSVNDARIRFIGTIYDQNKLRALRYYAFAYFHGHSVGGTNPSLLEALGCGNGVIAHENPFNREVASNAAEYFQEINDIPAIVNKLESNPTFLEEMRYFARRIIKDKYQWERITNEYYNLLVSEIC